MASVGWWRWLLRGVLLCLLSSAALAADESDGETEAPAAELKVANRTILVLRATLLGESPEIRAARARAVINEVLDSSSELKVSLQPVHGSIIVRLGDRRAFIVSPGDVDPVQYESVEAAANAAAQVLHQVVSENEESRNLRFMLLAVVYSVVATVVFLLLIRLIYFLRGKVLGALPGVMQRHTRALKLGSTQVVDVHQLFPVVSRVLHAVRWLIVLLLTYEWLSFVLSRFPYTRPWGESLNSYLVDLARYLFDGIVSAVPGLGVAVAIFFIARGLSAFVQRLLKRMAVHGDNDAWLNQETLAPTRRLSALAVWLFALAMAYPYLPGAGTEAFKGLSVLLGLMVSLGASSVIGQAASGLILTYTRTLRPGEYVRIGEHEGTVTEMGMFTTRIRTGLGEVLSIPNSMITGSVTKNYSRSVKGQGYVIDTTVTIGYDTPWRQVEAMLIEAARRTEGILAEPKPQVFQTALSDYYPEYRLVAQAVPSQPRPRAALLSALHAHIQDVFNEYGVQIMSPHYIADPQDAKWVPKENWYAEPARREPPGN
ncbi:mechanosensitive ion channel protein MscS [Pseudomonas sp. HAR-UPW-AIA-41]|uniref:mechanosensitive ion channel family protein n=1 Tax=Pseudomonas sp. HAR-UPW-AIA-41 TaxID=1985301 RepID=UPI000BB384CD|nr:mechanosensitive ion channel family protein [Pseudomonas sp. HAR-UPW-AIA-41]PAV47941.1 mechanosensitive ion channel protein MscS [Pseudomonas sp. HAR-UPW-AIA-41]